VLNVARLAMTRPNFGFRLIVRPAINASATVSATAARSHSGNTDHAPNTQCATAIGMPALARMMPLVVAESWGWVRRMAAS
jgi:hypothetical protein